MTNYNNHVYNKEDREIDKYLGTSNLRPGPPRRLINEIKETSDKKEVINLSFFYFFLGIANTFNWGE